MDIIPWRRPRAAVSTRSPRAQLDGVTIREEELISLWQVLQIAMRRKGHKTLGLIASAEGEGVSTIALGLARVVARSPDANVLICTVASDSELARGERTNSPSVVEVIFPEDAAPRGNVLQWLPDSRVAVASLSDRSWIETIATDGETLHSIIAALGASFEFVIFDLPPLGKSIASPALARALDGLVLVVEAERTRRQAVVAARDAIEMYGGHLLGVVLNKRRFHVPSFLYGP